MWRSKRRAAGSRARRAWRWPWLVTLLLAVPAAVYLPTAIAAGGDDESGDAAVIEFAAYADFPPFSQLRDGKVEGADIDIATALAEALGATAKFRLVLADESVEDDLRNQVWKGHYMGGGVANAMLHVPADAALAKRAPQVRLTRPYYAETVVVARAQRLRNDHTLAVFASEPVGVETASLADAYLLTAFGGRLRAQVRHYASMHEAAAALRGGETAALMGTLSEVEDGLGVARSDYIIAAMPTPGLAVTGWSVGIAVRADDVELYAALDQALARLVADGKVAAIFAAHQLTYTAASEPAR